MQTNEMIALRMKNLETLKKFYAPEYRIEGGAKYRAQFFTQDGTKQMLYPAKMYPEENERVNARELLLSQLDYAKGLDMDCDLYVTDDPNIFWSECRERGTITVDGVSGYYDGRSINIFTMEDGFIRDWRNVSTPWPLLKALGQEYTIFDPTLTDRPDYFVTELFQTYGREAFAKRNPFNTCENMVPLTAYGMNTRLAVHDEFDYSPEGDEKRARNKQTIFDMNGDRVREPGGYQWRSKLFGVDGLGTLEFIQEEISRDEPLVMYEPYLTADEMPDLPDWHEIPLSVYPTGNPNILWGETIAYNTKPGTNIPDETKYHNHYVYMWRFLDDGTLYMQREFHDAQQEHRNRGIIDPKLSAEAEKFYKGM